MQHFQQRIAQKCEIFRPLFHCAIHIQSPLFSIKQGKVQDFVEEIKQTSRLIEQNQTSSETYLNFYTQRLIQQFDLLKKTTDKLQLAQQMPSNFKSGYKFAKNLNKLNAEQRLEEYQKILRALNEKLSWLVEQCYACQDGLKKQQLQLAIQETEYRKQKCVVEIQKLS